MKKVLLVSILTVLSQSLLASAVQIERVQGTEPDVLVRQVADNKGEYPTTHSAFLKSLVGARVPGGVVSILNCDKTYPRRQTFLSSGSVQETMDAIVRSNPEYRWQVDNGVINLLTTAEEPALLNVQIRKFRVENTQSIDTVLDKLLELPEVEGAIKKLHLTPGVKLIVGPVPMDPDRLPKFNVDCENTTVKGALNAIVRAHGRSLWEYKEQRCDDKTVFNIDFIAKWL